MKKEEELSALDLMMAHADEMFSETVGAPKSRRRRRTKMTQDAEGVYDAMDLIPEHLRDQFEYDRTVEVGSRARPSRRRELEEVKRSAEATTQQAINAVTHSITQSVTTGVQNATDTVSAEFAPPRPVQRELDNALEELFLAQAKDMGSILEAIEDNTRVSQRSVKLFEEWMEWERARAYVEDNKVREEDHAVRADAQKDPLPPATTSSPTDLLEDLTGGRRRRGKRYGRQRGQTRRTSPFPETNPDLLPDPNNRPDPKKKWKLGKKGKFAVAAALAGYVVGDIMKSSAEAKMMTGGNAMDPKVTASPEAAPSVPTVPDVPTSAADNYVNAAALGGLLLTPAKHIPFAGPAIAAASGAYDASKIAMSDMTDKEKDRAYTKTAVSTGASVGGAGIGAAVGGFLGSIVPIAGTAAGALIGGVIGGALGDFFGDSIGEYVATKIEDDTEEAKQERERAAQALPQNSIVSSLFGIGSMQGQQYMGGNTGGMMPARPLRTGQSAAQLAQGISGMGVGAVSAFYESGNRGVGTISTGTGDAGGISYGRHQLSSSTGTMATFLNSPEGQKYLGQFGGAAPGTPQFNAAYNAVAKQDPEGFAKAQEAFITRTHYGAQMAQLQKGGIDLSGKGRAVQEAVYSVATQYGGSTDLIQTALAGKDIASMSQQDIINAIQDYRRDSVNSRFKSSSSNTRDSVRQRAEDERATLLQVAAQDEKPATPANVTQTDAQQVSHVQRVPEVKSVPLPPPEIAPAPVVPPVVVSAPAPVQPATAAPTRMDRVRATAERAQGSTTAMRGEENKHTLDGIPIYLDDPTMNLFNLGYA